MLSGVRQRILVVFVPYIVLSISEPDADGAFSRDIRPVDCRCNEVCKTTQTHRAISIASVLVKC